VERRDWSGDQKLLLQDYAQQNGLHVELDVTDDGDTPFAGFSTRPNCYPSFTLVSTPAAFFVTDQSGYTISCTETLARALDTLSLCLDADQAAAIEL
jgi:hypothetical protein